MLPRRNRVLASFGADAALVLPHLRDVRLHAGQVLCDPGEPVRLVYLPHDGAVAKLAVFEDGSEIECALVGREGAIGISGAFGLPAAITRDVCLLEMRASAIPSEALNALRLRSRPIEDGLVRYATWKMSCAFLNGACNARHAVEQRLCRWLLMCSDVLERREIQLPQDVFAKMLGVQRTSVNPILQKLRGEGLISLGRARLIIEDRPALMASACECYGNMKRVERSLLGVAA
jgi:CRP-like cAMP-binding protein